MNILLMLQEFVSGCTSAEFDGSLYWVNVGGVRRQATENEVLAATRLDRISDVRADAQARILAKYPDWRQRSAALGIYPQAYVTQMQADIAAVIEASNSAEDAVTAAADVAAVGAVTPNWPVI